MAAYEKLIKTMLDKLRDATGLRARDIGRLANAHKDGDHWFGNRLMHHAEIIASQATAKAMRTTMGHYPDYAERWLVPSRESKGQLNTTDIPSALHGTDGQFLSTTISSFNSVSLAPPLVLFSMARSALSLDLLRRAERYGITVLAEHQTELSNRFARASVDKSKDLRLQVMENGSPLFPD